MKEKSILKMVLSSYGNMLLAGVLCFIVSVSVSALTFIPQTVSNIILLFLDIPLFTALIYTPIWTEADRNRNMVQFGHIQKDPYKGLKIGLFLTIPYLLANFLLTLSKCGVITNIFALYKLFNAPFWPIVSFVNPVINNKILTAAQLPTYGMVIFWLISLYPLLVSVAAYYLGYKGISVTEKLIYKNKPRKRRFD